MELNGAINHLKESITDTTHKWGCEECKTEHEQLLGWLEDYKQLKEDYSDLDNMLRTANTENDRLQSVSSWIPCSERMPDSPIRCAVITENGLYGVSRYMGRNMIEWSLLGDIVTHWMPLPPVPEVTTDSFSASSMSGGSA